MIFDYHTLCKTMSCCRYWVIGHRPDCSHNLFFKLCDICIIIAMMIMIMIMILIMLIIMTMLSDSGDTK